LWIIYFCKCNCICLVTRNLNTTNQLCIIHNLSQLMLLALTNKQKVATNCVISYNNKIKEKYYYKIFLLPWLHSIYALWTQLLVTCSHLHKKLWGFVITLYEWFFTSSLCCIIVILSMYWNFNTLQFTILLCFYVQLCYIYFDYHFFVYLFWINFVLNPHVTSTKLIKVSSC
jgi:hypothetical protein